MGIGQTIEPTDAANEMRGCIIISAEIDRFESVSEREKAEVALRGRGDDLTVKSGKWLKLSNERIACAKTGNSSVELEKYHR